MAQKGATLNLLPQDQGGTVPVLGHLVRVGPFTKQPNLLSSLMAPRYYHFACPCLFSATLHNVNGKGNISKSLLKLRKLTFVRQFTGSYSLRVNDTSVLFRLEV